MPTSFRIHWLVLVLSVAALLVFRPVLAEWTRGPLVLDEPPGVATPQPRSTPLDVPRTTALLGLRPTPVRPGGSAAPRPSFRLLGTLASAHSVPLASVTSPSTHAITLGLGDVLDGWVLADVGHGRVTFVRDHDRFDLVVGGRVASSAVAPAPRSTSGTAPTRAFRRPELDGLIASLGPEVVGSTRVVPAFREGTFEGLKLFFPAGSPLTQLALEPGDVLVSANGQPLTAERAMALASQWRSLSSLEVGVRRRDRVESLRFTVE